MSFSVLTEKVPESVVKPDPVWFNNLVDDLYYSGTDHPGARHRIVVGLLLAFAAGVKASERGA